jgi:uncharacterized damage-inducible protein DinB
MATELDLIRRVYRYNSRTRVKYLTAIWRLPPRERFRDRGASFPTIVDIYMHVLDAYRWWFMDVYSGGKVEEEYPLGRRYTAAQAKKETQMVDRYVNRILRSLKPKDLDRSVRIRVKGKPPEPIPVRTLLVHMIEEELQHRGEMNALLWQAGRDPPVIGYDEPGEDR